LVPTLTAGKSEKMQKLMDFILKLWFPRLESGSAKATAKAYKVKSLWNRCWRLSHGINAKEFGYMVDAGMPQLAAIQSATITNAMFIGYWQ
jgi:hypothetical protein